MLAAIGHALMISFAMTWEILWALILGFGLSAIIHAVVSKEEMSRLLPDDSARTVAVACGLGRHHLPVPTPPSRSLAPCSARERTSRLWGRATASRHA
jgi:hypothetical protein